MQITFRVSNNDVAFRYTLLRQGDTGSVRVMNENTGFAFRKDHYVPLSAERCHDRLETHEAQL